MEKQLKETKKVTNETKIPCHNCSKMETELKNFQKLVESERLEFGLNEQNLKIQLKNFENELAEANKSQRNNESEIIKSYKSEIFELKVSLSDERETLLTTKEILKAMQEQKADEIQNIMNVTKENFEKQLSEVRCQLAEAENNLKKHQNESTESIHELNLYNKKLKDELSSFSLKFSTSEIDLYEKNKLITKLENQLTSFKNDELDDKEKFNIMVNDTIEKLNCTIKTLRSENEMLKASGFSRLFLANK